MKILIALLTLVSLNLAAQSGITLNSDSSVSLDGTIRINVALPLNHDVSLVDLFENTRRLTGAIARDTQSADVLSFVVNNRPTGTSSYSVRTRKWSRTPCTTNWTTSNSIQVQVGNQSCTRPTYVELTQTAPRSINIRLGLCSACQRYSIVYKQLNQSNPNIMPVPDVNVLGVGTRLSGYAVTLQEGATGVLNRSYPTSFGNSWYQVDVLCTNFPANVNKQTALIYVTN